MSKSLDPNLALATFPDWDKFRQIKLTEKSADYIVRKLLEKNCCAGNFSMGDDYTVYNICFTFLCEARKVDLPKGLKDILNEDQTIHLTHLMLPWSGGHGQLLVSIERVGAWAFNTEAKAYPSYLEEKFNHNFGTEVGENLCKFINTINKKFLKAKKV